MGKNNRIHKTLIIEELEARSAPVSLAGLDSTAQTTVTRLGDLSLRFDFASPSLADLGLDGEVLTLEGTDLSVSQGAPVLPYRTVNLLLPPGTELGTIDVEVSEPISLGAYHPVIGAAPILTSQMESYNAAEPAVLSPDWTPQIYQVASVQRAAGYIIASIVLYPITFDPVTTQALFYSSLTLVANTTAAASSDGEWASQVRANANDLARLAVLVDNPWVLSEYGSSTGASSSGTLSSPLGQQPLTEGNYDYVIITSDSLASTFDTLRSFKESRGIRTTIVTNSYVYGNYSGVDQAEQLRNFIRDAYTTWNASYVLLGGDIDIVPYRGAYASTAGYTVTSMPADLYFACLDGSWNSDGDGYWGEQTDGDGGADVDLLAEVYVGRAPVGDTTQAANFINKTILYETQAPPNSTQGLWIGEYLWDGQSGPIYGSHSKDPVRNGAMPDDYTYTTLYEELGTFSAANVIAGLNASPHVVNHLGHSNATYALGISNSDVDALTNTYPFLVYSQGCLGGAFDYSDSIAEHFVFNSTGAFASIMNARYGWGSMSNIPAYSHDFDYAFMQAIFQDGFTNIGAANQLSKEYNIGKITDTTYRWIYFGLNLLGDPQTPLYRGMSVLNSSPESEEIVSVAPTVFRIDLNVSYDPYTVHPSDLEVNGVPADVVNQVDADTLEFVYATSPVTAQGAQSIHMAAGALLAAGAGDPLLQWDANFYYDTLPLEVVNSNPSLGATVSLPLLTIDFDFSEPFDPASIGTYDLALSRGSIAAAYALDADTVRYEVSGVTGEGLITFHLGAGEVRDQYGNPNLAFSGSFDMDISTAAYPTPLAAESPMGSLIYDSTVSGLMNSAGDIDSFTINLEAGQTISAAANPLNVSLGIRLRLDGGAWIDASAAGLKAVLQTSPIAAPGAHTLDVSCLTGAGAYELRLTLNAALEEEEQGGTSNNSIVAAQDLDHSFISLGGTACRGAVMGNVDDTFTADEDYYSFTLNADENVTLVAEGTGVNLWLYDPSGTLVATSMAPDELDAVIGGFVAQAPGRYYVSVTANAEQQYALTVVKNASFDTEANQDLPNAQDITDTGAVLGYVGSLSASIEDYFSFAVNTGDSLTVETSTPGDGPYEFVNSFDPYIELYDPSGDLVASSDNDAVDGKNAVINHTAWMSGCYTVRVAPSPLSPDSVGEYFLRVQGATGDPDAPRVTAADPVLSLSAEQTTHNWFPASVTLDFSESILYTSVDLSDLTVTGPTAVNVTDVAQLSAGMLRFTLSPDGTLLDGTYTIALASGGVQDLQGTGNSPYQGYFVYDATGPRVVATSIQEGDILPASAASTVFATTLDERINQGLLDEADFSLVGFLTGSHPIMVLFGADNEIHIDLGVLPEDYYTLTIRSAGDAVADAAGNLLDGEARAWPIPPNQSGDGLPGGDFVVRFHVDTVAPSEYPATFEPESPYGSLIYNASATALMNFVGDVDRFTVEVEAGQTYTAVAIPLDPTLRLSVNGAPASAAGEAAIAQACPVGADGMLAINVESLAGAGAYELRLILNAAVEEESYGGAFNDTLTAAQDIDGSFIALGGSATRGAVAGVGDEVPVGELRTYVSADVPKPIPDCTYTYSTINITDTFMIADVNVELDISHTWNSDLVIYLQAPDGTKVLLFEDVGGNSDNFVNTVLDDEADTLIVEGFAPFTGSFRPMGTLSDFDGMSVAGDWTLEIYDAYSGDTGTLSGWSLIITETATSSDEDWYSFTAAAGDKVFAGIDAFGGSSHIELYDSSGMLLASGSAGAVNLDESISMYSIPATGTYYVMVNAAPARDYSLVVLRNAEFEHEGNNNLTSAMNITGTATVLASVTPTALPVSIESEPNDDGIINGLSPEDMALAIDLSGSFVPVDGSNYRAYLTGALQTASDEDIFGIKALPGDSLVVGLNGIGDSGVDDTYFELYNNKGERIAYDDDGGPGLYSLIDFTFGGPGSDYAGDYYLLAKSYGNSYSGDYELDAILAATSPLFADVDWYSYNLQAGEVLHVRTSTPFDGQGQFVNSLDPHIELYDSSGNLVGTGRVLADARNESIRYMGPAGAYYVKISAEGDTDGEYLLHADLLTDEVSLTASIAAPLDNGPDDLASDANYVLVSATLPAFVIQLDNGAGIDDDTVTASTVGVTRDSVLLIEGEDYSFSYDPGADQITLTSIGGDFRDGRHLITLSESSATDIIYDGAGNMLVGPLLQVVIDTTSPAAGAISITDNNGFTNDPTLTLTVSSNDGGGSGVSRMRFALSEAALAGAAWVPYATSYDQFDISAGGDGGKTIYAQFQDLAGNIQTVPASDTTYYDTIAPTADLASPANTVLIDIAVLNSRRYIDVTFSDPGGGLDVAAILDADAEFSLSGSAASGVSVNDAPTLVAGTTYRYAFTGSFGAGPVYINFLAGAWKDAAGNTNAAKQQSFTMITGQSAPYAQDFSGGLPGVVQGWEYYSSASAGRISVVNGALRLDSNGLYALNEAILHLSLAGQQNLQLEFKHRDSKDEPDLLPGKGTNWASAHQNGDGVAISDDGGITWCTLLSLGRNNDWTSYSIDLDQAVAQAGMTYSSNFLIKFQQYDNQWWGLDGREFDDISLKVIAPPPIDYTQDFSSGKPGESEGWTYSSSVVGGRIEVVNGALRMDSNGAYALNEAILRLNLTGNTNVQLRFDHRDSSDEFNAMTTGSWSGHQNGDGVAISNDNGATWHTVLSLGRELNWTTHAIDLDAVISSLGISYTSTFLIKFQQYDNCAWGADGREFDNISVCAIAEPINYPQDFSAGKPGASDGWQYYMSALTGRIQVVSGALRMDTSSSGVYSLNEALLCLNLTGSSNVQLRFDHRDSTDEYHAMTTGTWTGHANGDGVAISDDGGSTWYTIASLGRNTNWTNYIINLDAAIAAAGMDYVGDFLIKFQQYDNGAWGVDGREFDNISVTAV